MTDDTKLVNWISARGYSVIKMSTKEVPQLKWHVFGTCSLGHGNTWRIAVENAMRGEQTNESK